MSQFVRQPHTLAHAPELKSRTSLDCFCPAKATLNSSVCLSHKKKLMFYASLLLLFHLCPSLPLVVHARDYSTFALQPCRDSMHRCVRQWWKHVRSSADNPTTAVLEILDPKRNKRQILPLTQSFMSRESARIDFPPHVQICSVKFPRICANTTAV